MLIDLLAWTGRAADPFLMVLAALAFDAALGDPQWLYRAVPHPVALLGRAISFGEARLNDPTRPERARFQAGLILTAGIVIVAAGIGWAISELLRQATGGWLLEALLASSLIAGRSLYQHVHAVERGLRDSLDAGRAAVAEIVGRDPASLDAAGVRRASVESLAENFSDGVVAPALWYLLSAVTGLGLAGLCAYKAVNTLDSMIGHRSARYADFGRPAARLDDWVNWLPARLSGALTSAAAVVLPGANGQRAWRTMRRDAPRHRSPNAGWPEAAFAGALGLALAGPRSYGGASIDDAWMGDRRSDLDGADVAKALRLYLAACILLVTLFIVFWALPLG